MPHLFPLDDQPPGIAPARQLFDACAYRHLALSERDQVPFALAIRARVLYVKTQTTGAAQLSASARYRRSSATSTAGESRMDVSTAATATPVSIIRRATRR